MKEVQFIHDYNRYSFRRSELLKYTLQGSLVVVVISILFYQSILGVLLCSPVLILYLKRKKKEIIRTRKWQLNLEFRDGIISLLAALNAGYSIENAFIEALKDLKMLYHENSLIIKEFTYIVNQIKMNISVEQTLIHFGQRSGLEDVINFSEVFSTAKRTGGDLIHIIKITGVMIGDRIDVNREIITLVTAKKMEANIMKGIPIGMLCFFLLSSPGFLDPLYHNPLGIGVMSMLLMVYIFAYWLVDRIMEIEI